MAFLENGSWAPTSGRLHAGDPGHGEKHDVLEETVSIRSSLKETQLAQVEALAAAIDATIPKAAAPAPVAAGQVESSAFRSLSYGLFVLTAREGEKDNGCIINTMAQITTSPNRISICVNKGGLTHDMCCAPASLMSPS